MNPNELPKINPAEVSNKSISMKLYHTCEDLCGFVRSAREFPTYRSIRAAFFGHSYFGGKYVLGFLISHWFIWIHMWNLDESAGNLLGIMCVCGSIMCGRVMSEDVVVCLKMGYPKIGCRLVNGLT